MKKPEKVSFINQLSAEFKSSQSAIFVNYNKMDTKSIQALKKELKKAGAFLQVGKNTLIKLAAKEAGFPEESFQDTVLSGQTAVILGTEDAIAPIQVVGKFAKEREFPEIKSAVLDNVYYDKNGVLKLSTLPSKEVLYAQVVGGMSAPLYGLVGTLNANMQKLVWILKQKASQ